MKSLKIQNIALENQVKNFFKTIFVVFFGVIVARSSHKIAFIPVLIHEIF